MKNIEIIARGLCIQNEHILVCQHTQKNYFYLPVGHVTFFETTTAALQREWLEELNCTCVIEKYLTFFEERFIEFNKKHHEYTFLYQVNCPELNAQKAISSPEPFLKFQWLKLEVLPTQNLLPLSTKNYILSLIKNKTSI